MQVENLHYKTVVAESGSASVAKKRIHRTGKVRWFSLREILGISEWALAAYRDDTNDLHLTSISAHAAKVRTFAMFCSP